MALACLQDLVWIRADEAVTANGFGGGSALKEERVARGRAVWGVMLGGGGLDEVDG